MFGLVVDVNSLDHTASKTRNWYCLLPVLLGILLLVQAGSAKLQVNVQVSPDTISLGSYALVSVSVSDGDYPTVRFSNSPVKIFIFQESSGTNISATNTKTNASGWLTYSYTPPETGKYRINAETTVNYDNISIPNIGVKHAYSQGNVYLKVNPAPTFIPHVTTPAIIPLVISTTTPTLQPVTATPTAQQTLPVTQVTQPTQVTPVTQATQETTVPQTTSTVPASQSDTTPPVTTLTLTVAEVGSGWSSSDVICTLSAADNPGGSGVSVIQYSYDGTSWNTYRQPFPIDKTGPLVLYYRSSDNAGNTEVANVKAIAISSPGPAPAGTPANQAPGTAPAATPSADAVPFFPLPLWLVALILFVIVAAVGGALYLESQQKKKK